MRHSHVSLPTLLHPQPPFVISVSKQADSLSEGKKPQRRGRVSVLRNAVVLFSLCTPRLDGTPTCRRLGIGNVKRLFFDKLSFEYMEVGMGGKSLALVAQWRGESSLATIGNRLLGTHLCRVERDRGEPERGLPRYHNSRHRNRYQPPFEGRYCPPPGQQAAAALPWEGADPSKSCYK